MINRYENLSRALLTVRAQGVQHLHFLEVGTYDGKRATAVLRAWTAFDRKFTANYYGFDLFEDLTPEMQAAELSKSKLPPSEATVRAHMMREVSRTRIHLFKGNTTESLPRALSEIPRWSDTPLLQRPVLNVLPETVNLAFIDGGHSLATIQSDWDNVRRLMSVGTVVLFDDYYENRQDFGCKQLIDKLRTDPEYVVELLDPVDHIPQNGLQIRMAHVTTA